MTYRELWQKLTQAGWIHGHGSKHDLAISPDNPNYAIPVPRHVGNVPIGTANSILKAAGLK
jgi:predicted RNA binding protein YcfA (HicA-like mRNA interferase family)